MAKSKMPPPAHTTRQGLVVNVTAAATRKKPRSGSIQRVVANISGTTRYDTMEGKEYLVVPMVMMCEGVHAGSNGPLYYPMAELAKTPEVWNYKPIVIYHPQKNGQAVSACTPEVLTRRKVGVIMNAKWGTKLQAEAWLEPSRLAAVDGRVLEKLEADEMVELSTGLWTDNVGEPGEWNGEAYNAMAINFRPDHLAILPDQIGACSIDDGAGLLRVNAAGIALPAYLLSNAVGAVLARFTGNELSFSAISSAVGAAIRGKLGEDRWNGWVEDIYPGYVIYSQEGELYQQDYHISEGEATLVGTPFEVKRETMYVKVGDKPAANSNTEGTMVKKDIVDGLIANGGWPETDREFLMGLDERRLGVIGKAPPPPATNAATTTVTVPATQNTAPPATTATVTAPVTNSAPVAPAVTTQDVLNALKGLTPEQFIAFAPAGYRDSLQDGLAANAAERTALIGQITANANNTFSAEQLGGKQTPELRSLARLAGGNVFAAMPVANYAGAAGAPAPSTNTQQEALMPPTMNFAVAK